MSRIPPILVETISVSLVVYKATHCFRAPKAQGGSRFMDCILRYSVLYFVASVPAAQVLLPCLIHVNYSVFSVYVANLYVWATQKVTTRITILMRDADTHAIIRSSYLNYSSLWHLHCRAWFTIECFSHWGQSPMEITMRSPGSIVWEWTRRWWTQTEGWNLPYAIL